MEFRYSLHGLPVILSSDDRIFLEFFERFRKGWAFIPTEAGTDGTPSALRVSVNDGSPGIARRPDGAGPLYTYFNVSAFGLPQGVAFWDTYSSNILVDARKGTAQGYLSRRAMTFEGFTTVFSLVMAELLRAQGLYFLHSACLADARGRGWLICGWPGSGKTTLALGFLREGFLYLSDDAVLLTRSTSSGQAHSPGSLRQGSGQAGRAQGRRIEALSMRKTVRMVSGRRQKRSIDTESRFPERCREKCTPKILLHARLTGRRKSVLTPLSPRQSFLDLVPQSFQILGSHHRWSRRWSEDHAAVLTELTGQCASFRLEAGLDILHYPERAIKLVEAA